MATCVPESLLRQHRCATWHTSHRRRKRIEHGEQITVLAGPVGVQPAPAPMLGRIGNHMAGRAQPGCAPLRRTGNLPESRQNLRHLGSS